MKSLLLNPKIDFIEISKLEKLSTESEIVRKLEMTTKEIRQAKDELYRLSRNEKERELYFLREKSIKDEISALANAREKGIFDTKVENARNLLDVLDDETIALKIGLDIESVKALRNKD